MKLFLVIGAFLCSVAGDLIVQKHIVIENDCYADTDIYLDALQPETHPAVLRFALRDAETEKTPFCTATYRISVPEGQRLQISMRELSLDAHNALGMCVTNFLQARLTPSLTLRYCGEMQDMKESKMELSGGNIMNLFYLRNDKVPIDNHTLNFTISTVFVQDDSEEAAFECPVSKSEYVEDAVFFKCAKKMCVSSALKCDRHHDCPDGEDEEDCQIVPDATTEQSNYMVSSSDKPIVDNEDDPIEKPNESRSYIWLVYLFGGVLFVALLAVVIGAVIKHRRTQHQNVPTDEESSALRSINAAVEK